MRRSNIMWGSFLIMVGVLFLVSRYYDLEILRPDNFWPLFILIPGLIFEFGYFASMKDPGLLVPGGILTTIGTLFLFENMTGWRFAGYTWPVYPFSVAVGLFQLYIFGGREKGLLIPVFILGGVSIVSFCSMMFAWFNFSLILPIAMIILGLYIILSYHRK